MTTCGHDKPDAVILVDSTYVCISCNTVVATATPIVIQVNTKKSKVRSPLVEFVIAVTSVVVGILSVF
jgi:hypothetical protein